MLTALAILILAVAGGNHETINPLYQELRGPGVSLTANAQTPLPSPSMADGLDAASQQAVLTKIIGDRYPLDEFTRESVVAPFVLKFPEVKGGATRAVDVWFVIYGDIDQLGKDNVLKEFTTARGKDATLHVLTADELTARKLPATSGESPNRRVAPGETSERFVHTVAGILDHVELHQTLRCVLSRTDQSVVIATLVDHRFDSDSNFPNQYLRLMRDDNGDTTKGKPQAYAGAGGYLKATQLAAPKGAILVEFHSIYSEPRDWFNGANLLQSKLPILLQSRVRELRREVKK